MMAILDLLALLSVAGLATVWVVYPAVIGLVARLRGRPQLATEGARPEAHSVSVVIATREDSEIVRRRVRDLLRTGFPLDRLEVIVACDPHGEAPDVAEFEGRARRLAVVTADQPGGKAAALNAGIRAATGDVVVFADSHQSFEPETIPMLVDAVAAPGVGAATGSYDLAPGTRGPLAAYWRFEKWLRRAEARVHSSVGATGAVYAIRRHLWAPLPVGLILDDVYTPMRVVLAGYRVDFVNRARATELRAPTPTQEFSRKVRTLTGVLQLSMWLPAVLVPWRNPIWVQFVCHKLLRLLTPYWALFLFIWAAVSLAATAPRVALLVLLAVLLALAWSATTRRPWGTRLKLLFVQGIMLQVAVIVAGVNGLRRHWRVWDA